MGYKRYTGNELEALADKFLTDIYMKVDDVFESVNVMVPAEGMSTFLKQKLAAGGICANLNTWYPSRFIDNSVKAFLFPREIRKFIEDSELFSQDCLCWRIAKLLSKDPERYRELDLGNPKNNALDAKKTHEMSMQIASTLDRCQYHRPRDLEKFRFEKELQETNWLARIYSDLSAQGHGREHYFGLAMKREPIDRKYLPKKISIFGVTGIPKSTLNYFKRLSEFIDVVFFALNPSAQYWGDQRRARPGEVQAEGNRILANFGEHGREFFDNLLEMFPDSGDNAVECFRKPIERGESLLHSMQQDIFDVTTPDGSRKDLGGDGSVQVHSCHNRRREVEVMHDVLLDSICKLGLEYRDIVIAAPNIDDYAPIIKSVFRKGPLKDAISIADQSAAALSGTAEFFMMLLTLPSMHCTASEIYELLGSPMLRSRFRFSDADLENIRKMIMKSAIRWGADSADRTRFCGVGYNEFSWRDGIDRMWLGFAMGGESPEPGTSPVQVDQRDARLLGALSLATNRIFSLRRKLSERHTPEEFRLLLLEAIEELMPNDDSSKEETTLLRDAVNDVANDAKKAGFDMAITSDIFADRLRTSFSTVAERQPFMRGKISCCSLAPARSLPAKVIAVLGLNESEFPRRDLFRSFDPMNVEKIRGDQSKLQEDRYLFLETLTAARERLLFFYTGQSDRGSDPVTPAIPLRDFIEYMGSGYGLAEIKHRPHASSPSYFDGKSPDLFSYDPLALDVAKGLVAGPVETAEAPSPFGIKTDTAEVPEAMDINTFVNILQLPCRNFLRMHSDIPTGKWDAADLSDSEPCEIEDFSDKTDMVTKLLSATDEHWMRLITKESFARRIMPLGLAGEHLAEEMCEDAENSRSSVPGISARNKMDIDVSSNGLRITGSVECDENGIPFVMTWAKELRPKHKLKAWIVTILATLSRNERLRQPVRVVLSPGRGLSETKCQTGTPDIEFARNKLAKLVDIARRSFNEPLPLFPMASDAYVSMAPEASCEEAYAKARKVFALSGDHIHPDTEEPAVSALFRQSHFDDGNFKEEFIRLANDAYKMTPDLEVEK
ncbi:MAG: exodeoxyribonuclease V subunit gamma [Victivallaceae bacterium]|nr:exodeoxyribonuclease V subunit gamma [Victivallaceae bacterium]